MTALIVEIFLGIGGFNTDRGAELTMVDPGIDIQKNDVGGGSVPGKEDGTVTVELFKGNSEAVSLMGPD